MLNGGGWSFWKAALVVFLVALAARAGWGVYRWSREGVPPKFEFPDERQFWGIASSLWRGEGLRDELGFQAGRMPIYPALLAPFTRMAHGVEIVQVLQWIVGAAAAVLVMTWARRWGIAPAILAGGLVALDPFLVLTSSLLLTETLFIAVMIGFWYALWRAGEQGVTLLAWIVVGVLAGLCIYLRESSLGLVVVGLVWGVAVHRFRHRACLGAGCSLLIVVAVLLPWAYRNHGVLGEWRWLTTRGGISLYDGVGPQADGGSDLGDIKDSEVVRGMGEMERDEYFRREAWRSIWADPGRIVRLAGVKLARMWNPFPNLQTHQSRVVRWVSAGWMIPVLLLAAAGVLILLRGIRDGDVRLAVFLLLPAIYLSLLHAIFVGSVRYRLPAMPFLEILAAVGVGRLLSSRRRQVETDPRP